MQLNNIKQQQSWHTSNVISLNHEQPIGVLCVYEIQPNADTISTQLHHNKWWNQFLATTVQSNTVMRTLERNVLQPIKRDKENLHH